jgi:hypothetical protein
MKKNILFFILTGSLFSVGNQAVFALSKEEKAEEQRKLKEEKAEEQRKLKEEKAEAKKIAQEKKAEAKKMAHEKKAAEILRKKEIGQFVKHYNARMKKLNAKNILKTGVTLSTLESIMNELTKDQSTPVTTSNVVGLINKKKKEGLMD